MTFRYLGSPVSGEGLRGFYHSLYENQFVIYFDMVTNFHSHQLHTAQLAQGALDLGLFGAIKMISFIPITFADFRQSLILFWCLMQTVIQVCSTR